jgi:hypothetical protein
MIPRRRGKIINFCSLLTFQGGLTVPAYAAAKGALGQLTKALSNEWSKDNVQVNAICPGYIATDMSVVRPALVYLISPGGFRPRHHRCGPHLPTPRRSADGTDRSPPSSPFAFSPHHSSSRSHPTFFYLPYLPARLLPCSPARSDSDVYCPTGTSGCSQIRSASARYPSASPPEGRCSFSPTSLAPSRSSAFCRDKTLGRRADRNTPLLLLQVGRSQRLCGARRVPRERREPVRLRRAPARRRGAFPPFRRSVEAPRPC